MTIVEARDAHVAIDKVSLLAPTSFFVAPGEALAVTGSNGSGKTTLLRVLAGKQQLTGGSVAIAGAAPNEKDAEFRARLAALLGLPPLSRSLTLHEHLALVAASWGDSVELAREAASDALRQFGIQRLQRRFVHELSSGQTQMFALALTLIRPSEILLLDEPEQRLDAERRELLADVLAARVASGTTLIMASHSAELVGRVCDRELALAEDVA